MRAPLAQDKYPSKPVKIIVPYAPGGATDIVARIFGEQLRKSLGQTFVVESKPGAFGIIAIEEMARAKPDGYTLMIGNVSTNAITPVLYAQKFTIELRQGRGAGVAPRRHPAFLIVTTKNFAVKTVAELVAYAKKNPGKVRYASVGIGSYPAFRHGVLRQARRRSTWSHIPNKAGAAGMINDLVIGDAQAAFLNVASTAAMIKAGKLRPLAVRQRASGCPNIPTCRRCRRPAIPGVGTLPGRACWRPPARRRRCSRPCTRRSSRRCRRRRSGGVQEADFSIVPNKSLEEAADLAERRDRQLGRRSPTR